VTIESVTGEPRYHKKIDLRAQIDPTTARSTYKNGILEVTLKLKGRSSGGVSIPIE
jgi:HSP20 family protein